MKLRSSKIVGSIAASTRRAVSVNPSVKCEENVKASISRESLNIEDSLINSQEPDVASEAGSPLTSFPSSPVQRSPNSIVKGKGEVEIKKEFIKVEKIEQTIVNDTFLSLGSTSEEVKISRKRTSVTIKKEEERDRVIIKSKTQKKSGRNASGKEYVPITPPPSWEEAFLRIQEYRKTHSAPVDSMGCERTDVQDLTPKEFRFHVLVALMLSSQTKDEETYAAMAKLRKAGGGKLTAEVLDAMDEDTLHDCIRQVGFHNMKTNYVKNAARICIEKHEGDIPSTLKDLMALPGVGPKMAFLAMQCGWDVNIGIGVDVHVHRITNRLGWVQTKHPEETRASLESWLPEKWWKAINFLLVGLGQTVCYANRPRCYTCPVSDLCPSLDPKSVAPAKGKPLPRVRSAEPKILLEIEKPQVAAKIVRSRHFIKKEAPSEIDPLFEE